MTEHTVDNFKNHIGRETDNIYTHKSQESVSPKNLRLRFIVSYWSVHDWWLILLVISFFVKPAPGLWIPQLLTKNIHFVAFND